MELNASSRTFNADALRGDAELVQLFSQLHDAVSLFRDLADRSRMPMHQQYARRQMFQRQAFLRDLRTDLEHESSEPRDGTLAGHWRQFRKSVSSWLPGAERKMLRIVDESEEALSAEYTRLLQAGPRSEDLRGKLERQNQQVLHSRAELRDLLSRQPALADHGR